ncbi:hypothetical protein JTE90_001303, partial [Oedothorax gibbosus]
FNGTHCIECNCGNHGECYFDSQGAKQCNCHAGYIINSQEQCQECDCGTHGNCSFVHEDKKYCTCEVGYSVNKQGSCQPCDCGDEGFCSFDKLGGKNCTCSVGYVEYQEKCTECNCGVNGTCNFSNGSKACQCDIGYILNEQKMMCYDPCASEDCKHESYCEVEKNELKCYCKLNFNGTTCDKDIEDEEHICEENPCENGGECYKNQTNYFCKCKDSFHGINCTISEWCYVNNATICGMANCVFDKETKRNFCSCKDNQIFDAKAKKCKKMNKCINRFRKNECMLPHETCEDGICKCEKSYEYKENKTECVFNVCYGNPCGSNLVCKDSGDGSYTCSCEEGSVYNGETCEKLDECSAGVTKCKHFCTNGLCSCAKGFYLNSDNTTCGKNKSTDLCEKDCGSGQCVIDGESEVCVCPTATHKNTNGTCKDLCAASSSKLLPKACPSGIKCESHTVLGFRCICDGQYKQAADGIHCEVKNMCTGEGTEQCEKQTARCIESPESAPFYKCVCADGYAMDSKTNKCIHLCSFEEQVKECLKKLALCEIEETTNGTYKAVCNCPPLFTDKGSDKCDKKAEYSYTGSFQVPRNVYEVLPKINKRLKRSIPPIDYIKLNKDFKESLNKVYENFDSSKVLNCSDNGQNLNCSLEIQLEKAKNKAQLNVITAPYVCISQEKGNYCLVPPRLLVERNIENDVFEETSPCNEDISLCGPTTDCVPSNDKSFQCKCKNGFAPTGAYKPFLGDDKSSIQICKDVDECLKPKACPNTTECFNLYGSYDCLCKSNFRKLGNGDIKTVGCVAVCDPNPCIHGTCNTTGNHGYTCSCDSSYTGFLCDEPNTLVTKLKETARKHSALIGGILGALLVVAIIVCFILFKKLKGKSVEGDDEYTKHRQRGILSEMSRLGRRQPKPENEDIEVERRNIPTIIANESGDYRRQYRDNDFAIPRPQVSQKRESGDYRSGYSGDDQMFQKSSRQSEDAPGHGRRKLSRSSERLDTEQRRISLAQYRNEAYEEE